MKIRSEIVFVFLTSVSFLLMIVARRLRKEEDSDTFRKNKQYLEYLTILSFVIAIFSLIGNWTIHRS
jgi:hypothetical protein